MKQTYTATEIGMDDYIFVTRNGLFFGTINGKQVFTANQEFANPINRCILSGEMESPFDFDSVPSEA